MTRPYDREVPPVHRGDLLDIEPLGESYDGRVNEPEPHVGIDVNDLGSTREIGDRQLDEFQLTARYRGEECGFLLGAKIFSTCHDVSVNTVEGTSNRPGSVASIREQLRWWASELSIAA